MAYENGCDVCGKAGVSRYFIQREHGEGVWRKLCIVHADVLRMLESLTPANQHRYSNPGDEPLSRKWITGETVVEPLDWMPVDVMPMDLTAGDAVI